MSIKTKNIFITKGGNVFRKLKSALQILVGVALIIQLAGCFFVDHDRGRHNGPPGHDDNGNDPGIDIRVHG